MYVTIYYGPRTKCKFNSSEKVYTVIKCDKVSQDSIYTSEYSNKNWEMKSEKREYKKNT